MKAKRIIKTTFRLLGYLILSLLLALVIRVFLCNFYRVPSGSMLPTLEAGDFIMAEKWTYGARLFRSLHFGNDEDPPITRVPGFGQIERGDVVVFNFPYRRGWDSIRMHLSTFYVKRCIGIAGDSLSIVGGYYHIAGRSDTVGYIPGQRRWIRASRWADSAILRTIHSDTLFRWNAVNFGPLYIPAKGATIALNARNYALYHKQIAYETNSHFELHDSLCFINDSLCRSYTFRNNWYFMAGDNVSDSQDSRYIGLVPEIYIVGRVCMIMSSREPESGDRRWRRWLKRVK